MRLQQLFGLPIGKRRVRDVPGQRASASASRHLVVEPLESRMLRSIGTPEVLGSDPSLPRHIPGEIESPLVDPNLDKMAPLDRYRSTSAQNGKNFFVQVDLSRDF